MLKETLKHKRDVLHNEIECNLDKLKELRNRRDILIAEDKVKRETLDKLKSEHTKLKGKSKNAFKGAAYFIILSLVIFILFLVITGFLIYLRQQSFLAKL